MTESMLHLQTQSAFAINACLYVCVCPLSTFEAYKGQLDQYLWLLMGYVCTDMTTARLIMLWREKLLFKFKVEYIF